MTYLTQSRLREMLEYVPETGKFVRARDVVGRKAGSEAGSLDTTGYIRIGVANRVHLAHRLAFLYMTGEWPEEHVDHINGVRTDNRWVNLRPASKSVNMQNRRAKSGNAAGLLGVSRNGGRWSARIHTSSGPKHLGTYSTPEEAHQVYLDAKRVLHAGCTI